MLAVILHTKVWRKAQQMTRRYGTRAGQWTLMSSFIVNINTGEVKARAGNRKINRAKLSVGNAGDDIDDGGPIEGSEHANEGV